MIQEDGNFERESNPLGGAGLETPRTGYDLFQDWAKPEPNVGIGSAQMDADLPPERQRTSFAQNEQNNKPTNDIAELGRRAIKNTQDNSDYVYNTSDVSKRYKKNFIGQDNESIYAGNQTTAEKAYNGVVKMAGTAATTFINGTVGLVYGIASAASAEDGHRIHAFYNNDLSNYLNNINTDMEDTYAHYKNERERTGDWWEPSNLFTANFLFDNIIKNLGFSLGAAGAGFAWGGALKAIGLTSKLMGTGEALITQADTAISEASLLPQAERMGALTSKLNDIYNSAKSVAGAGLMKADRGIVATFGTFGEAGIEALNNSNEYRSKAIENFKLQHGYDPDETDLAQINREAESVGNWSFGLNSALLSVTNYVQLPKIYSSSFKAEKNIMNGVKLAAGEYVETLPSKGFGKMLYKAKNLAGLAFEGSEAFEEGAQFAIQTGTQNYFSRKSKDRKTSALEDGLLFGIGEALTTGEGTLNIFTGGFSGALQSSGVVGRKGLIPTVGTTGKIGERGWTGYGGTAKVEREQAIKDLNDTRIKTKLKSAHENLLAGESIQADREIAISQGDILESKDLEFDYAHTFVETRLKYQAKDAIQFELESLREQVLAPGGFGKLVEEGYAPKEDTPETFIARLDNLQNHANHAAKLYDSLNLKYSAIMTPDGKRKYDDLVIDKLVYAGAKVNDYDKRIRNLNNDLVSKGVNTQGMLDAITDQGMPTDEALGEGFGQIDSMKGVTDDVKEDMKRDLLDVIEMALRKREFINEYNDIIKKPENHRAVEEPEVDPDAPKETIKLTTKGGEREVEIGTEYVLGRVVKYTKSGKEVYRQPRLTILADNGDGTIKIKDSTGAVRDISKKELESYGLTKASKMETDKKFKFFARHQNSVFIHKGIKISKQVEENGKMVWKKVPARGRLTYNNKKGTLNFVYRDGNGKLKSREVFNTMFKAQGKFPKPMIEEVEILKADEETTRLKREAIDEFVTEEDQAVSARNAKRVEVLAQLSDEIVKRKEETKNLIARKSRELANIKADLERTQEKAKQYALKKGKTKVAKFKEIFNRSLNHTATLAKSIEDLKEEISTIEDEIEELDYNLQYLNEFSASIEDLPTTGRDLLAQLRDDRKMITDAIAANKDTILHAKSLIGMIEDAIKHAKELLKDAMSAFLKKNPNILTPTGEEVPQYLNTSLMLNYNKDTTIGENQQQVAELRDYLAYLEEDEIAFGENKLEDLKESIEYAQNNIVELEKQLKAHDLIYDKFKQVAADFRAGKAQEREQMFSETIKKQLLEQNDNSIQNTIVQGEYEPDAKKDKETVVTSTIVPLITEKSKEHIKRADIFGYNFDKLKNKDKIKGIILTQANQGKLLPNLMEHLAKDASGEKEPGIDPSTTIAMVFVRKGPRGIVLVDKDGKDISDTDPDQINKAIYQVFPKPNAKGKLEWDYPAENKSMFREGTTQEEIDEKMAYYNGWREEQLKNEDLGDPQSVEVSTGIMEYVKKPAPGTESTIKVTDFAARIPVQDSKLIETKDLLITPVMQVGINKTVSKGSTAFKNAAGKVFLRLSNGLVPVNNRKFNEREIGVMYDVMLQATKNASPNRDGDFRGTETQQLFAWLRSVCYWGTAKTQNGGYKKPGRNNIWFDAVDDDQGKKSIRLFIGNQGDNFPFTETGLTENKDIIQGLLKELYFNTNASIVNDKANPEKGNTRWNDPYFEIIGIKEDGTPIRREWNNYQAFLLSNKIPDADMNLTGTRDIEDIPLTTNVRPVLGEGDRNRKQFYFTLTTTRDDITVVPKEEEVVAPTPVQPVAAPVAPTQPVVVPTGGAIKMDNSYNTLVLQDEGYQARMEVNYRVDPKLITAPTIMGVAPAVFTEVGLQYLVDDIGEYMNAKTKETTVKEYQALIASGQTPAQAQATLKTKYEGLRDQLRAKAKAEGKSDAEIAKISYPVIYHTNQFLPEFNPAHADLLIQSIRGRLYKTVADELAKQQPAAPVAVTPVAEPAGKTVAEIMAEEAEAERIAAEAATITAPTQVVAPPVTSVETPVITPEPVPASVPVPAGETTEVSPEQEAAQAEAAAKQAKREAALAKLAQMRTIAPNQELRVVIKREAESNVTQEKWDKVEEFIKRVLPNIPLYRVKNIIQATNGRQAWGMLQDGAIYVYEGAVAGTAYHEVYEAVWKMFVDNAEKESIYKEFRARKGVFEDRESGNLVPFYQATNHQIKEQLAEEFKDHVLVGNAKPKSFIRKLFDDIIEFIKAFFSGPKAEHNTNELFKRIGNGYYKKYNPFEKKLGYATKGIIDVEEATAGPMAEYSLADIPISQQNEILQHMTYAVIRDAVSTNKGLFNVIPRNKNKMYDALKDEITGLINWKMTAYPLMADAGEITREVANRESEKMLDLYMNLEEDWDAIRAKHENHLKAYDITFDENDEEGRTSDDRRKDDGYGDARQIDSFRKANSAVKILLSTLPVSEVITTTDERGKSVTKKVAKISSMGGNIMIPGDKVFITLKNELHNAIDIDDMLNKLRVMALNDSDYITIYKRLTKNQLTGEASLDIEDEVPVDYTKLDVHDFDLISAFWNAMKGQNADAITVFILPGGETVVSDTTLSSAAKASKREMINNIIKTIKNDDSDYFEYSNRKYNPKGKIARDYNFNHKNLQTFTNFLAGVGVDFPVEDIKKLSDDQQEVFIKVVEGIRDSFAAVKDVVNLNSKTLDIDGRLLTLGTLKAIIEKPEFESTYFNLNGDKTQTFLGSNIMSNFYDTVSRLDSLNDVDNNPKYAQYKYLNTDSNAQGSVILGNMFLMNSEGKERIKGTRNLYRPVYVDGTNNEDTGKKTESSKLTYKQRLVQEINLNLNGIFMNLVPGDASIEWAIKMFNAGSEFVGKDSLSEKTYHRIFKNYFLSEVNLAREGVIKDEEGNVVEEGRRVAEGKNARDLRFFKDILSAENYAKIYDAVNNDKITPEEVFKSFEADIMKDVDAFIDKEAKETARLLRDYKILYDNEKTGDMEFEGIELPAFAKESDMHDAMRQLAVNYMISNIEMHKLVYADPYQYSDELKRIKNFNSPRKQLTVGSNDYNNGLHKTYNRGYKPGDIGYSDMNRDHFRTVTLGDVRGFDTNKGYDNGFKETDGGGLIIMKATRKMKIRAAQWTTDNERQYRHDVGFEELVKSGATRDQIDAYELNNPDIKDTYTPLKPITAGSKANRRNYNDIVLHKFALVPVSFRIQYLLDKDSNIIKLYDKMMKEDIDYAVYESGSKVGTEAVHQLYDPETGDFNNAPFESQEQRNDPKKPQGISNIPFSIVAIQSEVPSKDTPLVRQGTQITKLATMDFMEAGVPVDFKIYDAKNNEITDFQKRMEAWISIGPNLTEDETEALREEKSKLYKEIRNNQRLLEAKIQDGYDTLLKKLGITETRTEITLPDGKKEIKKSFTLKDTTNLVKTLKDEVLKREINENIIEALDKLNDGSVIIEATPVYQQIRNILFSIADKNVVSPKISGGMKVQISSALLESNKTAATLVKGKLVYNSDILDFYKDEDGKRVCEVMVGRWFDSDMTDEQLVDYFNNDPEGKKHLQALMGVGFRIPTQKQNSIDVFKIKKFLPKAFGDSIVIPSALVNKAGSDFDIDKLSIYLKNIFQGLNGKPEVVPFYGIGEAAKAKFKPMFDAMLKQDQMFTEDVIANKDFQRKLFADIAIGASTDKLIKKWMPRFQEMFKDLRDEDGILHEEDVEQAFMDTLESLNKRMDKLTNADIQEVFRTQFIDKMYKQSLENAYIESLQNLISAPENYENLVKPNDASQLSNLAKKINGLLGRDEIDYGSAGNMLSRGFMSNLRQAFVSGKYAIGIAAVGQTGHAQRQRTPTYIDTDKMNLVPIEDRALLGDNPKSKIYATDTNVNFQDYNKIMINGKLRPALALIKNKAKIPEYISDLNGMFIDGYVDISKGPWIMELGATPNVTATWLFLIDLGVPINTIAYFMNQPIIKDYLTSVENKGYSWLFIDDLIKGSLDRFAPKQQTVVKGIPGENALEGMVGKKVSGTKEEKLSDDQLAQQQYMLKEFLKYAKLASHLFNVTQGSNFDTATLNDPYLIFKKQLQYEKGKNTLISSIDDLADSSFIAILRDIMYDVRNAMSTILLSDRNDTEGDKTSIRAIMQQVLRPFVDMPDRAFVKTSQKAVSDLFDWAMQTETGYSAVVAQTLLGSGTEDSYAEEIIAFRDKVLDDKEHPLYNNTVIQTLRLVSGEALDKPDNLEITAKDGKAYNQDLIIGSFRELRDNADVKLAGLYGKLVRVAIMQSGLTNSPISFSQLLPYEDFSTVYNSTLTMLETQKDVKNFSTLNIFYRNNWSNQELVPKVKANVKYYPGGSYTNFNETHVNDSLKNAMRDKIIPKIINIKVGMQDGKKDFITYARENPLLTQHEKDVLKKAGDYSYIEKFLMQKVYTEEKDQFGNRLPLVQKSVSEGVEYYNFVYKAMNAWGDSFRAKEFYKDARPSVLNNEYEKVETEVTDKMIVDLIGIGGTVIRREQPDTLMQTGEIAPEDMDFGLTAEHFEDMFYDQRTDTWMQAPTSDGEQKNDSFIEDTTKYIAEHALVKPGVEAAPFGKKVKELFADRIGLISVDALTMRVRSILENRIANDKSSMSDLPEFVEKKFGKKLKLNMGGYEKLALDAMKANENSFFNLGHPTRTYDEKMSIFKDAINKENVRLKEATRIINNVFAQLDPSIPKLYPEKATPQNSPSLYHLADKNEPPGLPGINNTTEQC